jgi:hypothetical protein
VRADARRLRLPRLARDQRLGTGRQGRHGLVDVGSDDDNWVAADRGVGTARDRDPKHDYIGSCHKVWYLPPNNIEYGDFLHDTSKRISADVYCFNCQSGSWVKDLTPHWPVRRADLAVTFGNR